MEYQVALLKEVAKIRRAVLFGTHKLPFLFMVWLLFMVWSRPDQRSRSLGRQEQGNSQRGNRSFYSFQGTPRAALEGRQIALPL